MKFISEPYKNNSQISFRISSYHSFPVSSEAVYNLTCRTMPLVTVLALFQVLQGHF